MNVFHFLYVQNLQFFVLMVLFGEILLLSFHRLTKRIQWQKYVVALGLAIYIALIIYQTLLHREAGTSYHGLSLKLFETYYLARTKNVEYYREALMNVAFFVPLGTLFCCLEFEKLQGRKWMIIPIGFCFSFLIEAAQYVFKLGFAQIDDVMHNTLGVVIGVLLYIAFQGFLELADSALTDK